MRRTLLDTFEDSSATAAAEMALVMPFLVALLFGSFELGTFFHHQHIVAKAVRDGARFAGRQAFASFPCNTELPAGQTSTRIKEVVLYGKISPTTGDQTRLPYWKTTNGIGVRVSCLPDKGSFSGIYENQTSVPRVIVSAEVPYPSLFGILGIKEGLKLSAKSEAAVVGA
jgi:Flp pilus assembly protein TadG